MTAKTSKRKMGNLYAGLSDIERARLLARLWREDNDAELDRLRDSISTPEAGRAYNEALSALRGLNSPFVYYNLLYLRTGFDRDYFAWNTLNIREHEEDTARSLLMGLAKLLAYPITESELAAVEKRDRALLLHVEDWADLIFPELDTYPLRAELAEIVREYEESSEPEGETETKAHWQGYYDRITSVVRDAIERKELPNPPKAPKDALGGFDGIWLPNGALTDWAYGREYRDLNGGDAAPALEFFTVSTMPLDTHPDSEAAQVKARREELRGELLSIGRYPLNVPADKIETLSIEPALTERAWKQASDYTATLWEASNKAPQREDALRAIMAQFAERKASLRAFIDAIEAVQSALFGGEDALDSNTRGFLDEAIRAQEAPEKVLDLYERIPPQGDDPEPWPHVVAAMGDTIYETLRPHYEAAIRGGGI